MSGSSSEANQQQTQDSQDNRIASAENSVNLVTSRSSIGGSVFVSSTDNGAVNSALRYANATNDSAMKAVNATTDSAFKYSNAMADSAFKLTDGTVSKAFDFAGAISAGAANELAASGARDQAIATSAMGAVQQAYGQSSAQVADAYKGVSDTLAAAYTTAKAGEQKVMVAVGVAAVAMIAMKALGGKAA